MGRLARLSKGIPRGLPPRLPAGVADGVGMRPGEKVVAWGSTAHADGPPTYLLCTDRALYLQAAGERVPWHRISKATWDDPILELRILDDTGRSARALRLRVDQALDLPPAVHDRVTDSVVVTERVDLGEGQSALMSARRDSDDGQIRWSVVFEAGLDARDPGLRARAEEALARLRSSLGI